MRAPGTISSNGSGLQFAPLLDPQVQTRTQPKIWPNRSGRNYTDCVRAKTAHRRVSLLTIRVAAPLPGGYEQWWANSPSTHFVNNQDWSKPKKTRISIDSRTMRVLLMVR